MPDTGIREAVEILRAGGLVGFPTETVYGLGADASSPEAVVRCFAAKGRPSDHPVIVHVAAPTELDTWSAAVPASARQLASAFWPGPLTVVVPRADHVLDEVTGGQDTVALRMPDQTLALALLDDFARQSGRPSGIVAPSANRFGHVSPTTADAVVEELGAAVDLVLDGGPCAVGVESTIVDCTVSTPRVLRPGAVTDAEIAGVLRPLSASAVSPPAPFPPPDTSPTDSPAPRVPGSLETHYAPQALVVLVGADEAAAVAKQVLGEGRSVGVLGISLGAARPDGAVELPVPSDPTGYARELYASLRDADRRGLDVVVAVPPPAEGIGVAVADRLARAAGRSGLSS